MGRIINLCVSVFCHRLKIGLLIGKKYKLGIDFMTSYTITVNPYTILNFINGVLTLIVLGGCFVWLSRFAISAIKFKDRIGMFLVVLALLLIIGNFVSISVQFGQGLGLTEYRVVFATVRLIERIISVGLMVLMFYLGRETYSNE